MKSRASRLAFLFPLLLVAACAGRPAPEATAPAEPIEAPAPAAEVGRADGGGVGAGSGFGSGDAGDAGGAVTVLFEFDSAIVSEADARRLDGVARRLVADPALRVRVEGHTDERGSAEYNIGLGQRRATAVRRVLALRGVEEGRIVTISYGEERPAAEGSSESAWSLNRRAEVAVAR